MDIVIEITDGMAELATCFDALRPSRNLVRRHQSPPFDGLTLRAACPARPGEGLLEATHHHSEYTVAAHAGTLVGFWAPDYARAVSVPGYHFQFISDDRRIGGHVLDGVGGALDVGMQDESGLHLAIPETAFSPPT